MIGIITIAVFAQSGVLMQDEGSPTSLTKAEKINCVGSGVTCSQSGKVATINASAGGAANYQTIKNEGTSLTQRATVNFLGLAIDCADDGVGLKTDCTISVSHALVSSTHTDVTGAVADDDVLVRGAANWETKQLPSCSNGTTSKLLYNSTSNAFSCGTDQTGGGGGNYAEVTVTLADTGGAAATVVTGQAWVTGTSKILCAPFNDGAESNNTDEVYQLAQFSLVVSTRVVGIGFTLSAYSPVGVSGNFKFHCTGV